MKGKDIINDIVRAEMPDRTQVREKCLRSSEEEKPSRQGVWGIRMVQVTICIVLVLAVITTLPYMNLNHTGNNEPNSDSGTLNNQESDISTDSEQNNQDEEKSIEDKNWKWDYDEMLAMNKDTKGYIKQDDSISYPIVQGANNDYYLIHGANHEQNKEGAIHIDSSIEEALDARHCIVYGHNMNDGAMFAPLVKYKSEDYYMNHKTMEIYVKEKHYVYYVFGAYETSAFDGLTYSFDKSDNEFLAYIQMVKDRTPYDIDLGEIGIEDKILTLSTSTNYNGNRFVVQLIRGPEIKE